MEGYGVPFNVNKVRRLMTEQGYSANRFSLILGWQRSQMHKLLKTGRARPETLDQIAYQLGCSISDLLMDEQPKHSTIEVMLKPGAKMPTRAHDTDAGLDLYAMEGGVIPARGSLSFDTGVHCAIPKGFVGLLTSKSGLMVDEITSRGTIDADYRGSIKAILFNHSKKAVTIEPGQKVTQMVIVPIITPRPVLVVSFEQTARGDKGFGSSGKF
jgi:dUTP pyrophosphatase